MIDICTRGDELLHNLRAQPHSRQAVTIGRQRSLSPGLNYCPR